MKCFAKKHSKLAKIAISKTVDFRLYSRHYFDNLKAVTENHLSSRKVS